MRYGTNKEKNTVRGGVMMTGKGEPWHTKEEEDLFVQAHEVFLWPVQLSGTVCRSLLKRLRHLTLGRSRKS